MSELKRKKSSPGFRSKHFTADPSLKTFNKSRQSPQTGKVRFHSHCFHSLVSSISLKLDFFIPLNILLNTHNCRKLIYNFPYIAQQGHVQRQASYDRVRMIVQEEGRTARNLITWSVPLENEEAKFLRMDQASLKPRTRSTSTSSAKVRV